MTVHHLTGEGDRFICLHGRVFRRDVGNQIVGVSFHGNPDNGYAPERIVNVFYKHDPGGFQPLLDSQKECKALGCYLVVDHAFHEDPADDHLEHIDDEEPECKSAQGAQKDQDQDSEIVRTGDGCEGRHHGDDDRTGTELVYKAGEHAAGASEYGASGFGFAFTWLSFVLRKTMY